MKRLSALRGANAASSSALFLAAALAILAPGAASAQIVLFGAPSNFDVYNDTGKITHGFEIELQGLTPQQVGGGYGFRYGSPVIVATPAGTIIRFAANYASNTWDVSTDIPAAYTPTGGHSCTFGIVGCDHFGYYLPYYGAQPTKTIYRWLIEDVNNPGNLVPAPNNIVQVPAVTVSVVQNNNGGVAVAFEIPVPPPPAPEIPKPDLQYGVAKWVKVLKNEVDHAVQAPDLLEDNPVVPVDNNPAQVETAWKLLQFNPHSANSGVLHHQAVPADGKKAVVRKYEFYKFSGAYDAATHKAICGGDGLCTAPLDGELGDFIGNQMAAANIGVSSITVSKAGLGSGTVTSDAGKLNCGSACSANLALGTAVTLTAKPNSNATFAGWAGDCAGAGLTCTFSITGENKVTANFAAVAAGGGGGGGGSTTYKISTSINGKGTVTSNPAAASYAPGTVVTLTATPAAGQPWIGWGGACVGTSNTCTLTMDANKSVTANFR